jgi:hypothetical protein
MASYKWTVTLHTATGTSAPGVSALTTALGTAFATHVSNVSLAGPQSVDDEPVEPIESPSPMPEDS